jgi:hypothetical protein
VTKSAPHDSIILTLTPLRDDVPVEQRLRNLLKTALRRGRFTAWAPADLVAILDLLDPQQQLRQLRVEVAWSRARPAFVYRIQWNDTAALAATVERAAR